MEINWLVFGAVVFIALFLDLFVFHRTPHKISIKESLLFSLFWFTLGVAFGGYVYYTKGLDRTVEYFTAYLLEKSLSLDNIFVFILIFSYFKIPEEYRHKVLFWGVLGAIVTRFIFIFTGLWLVEKINWIVYAFGLILIASAVKILTMEDKEFHPENTLAYRIASNLFPMKPSVESGSFFIREGRKVYATPLFLALMFVESSDIMFAIDSVPAVIAVSRDPFVVYTSNIFAILGLRALYFAASTILPLFHYIHYGLAFVLAFIGFKMLVSNFYHIPPYVSLLLIISVLAISMIASIVSKKGNG